MAQGCMYSEILIRCHLNLNVNSEWSSIIWPQAACIQKSKRDAIWTWMWIQNEALYGPRLQIFRNLKEMQSELECEFRMKPYNMTPGCMYSEIQKNAIWTWVWIQNEAL
jgi:hypothetical protein